MSWRLWHATFLWVGIQMFASGCEMVWKCIFMPSATKIFWTQYWTEEAILHIPICKGLTTLVCWGLLKETVGRYQSQRKANGRRTAQIEKEELELQRAQLMLRLKKQEFGQRKQSVEDHKLSIMKKLGQKLSWSKVWGRVMKPQRD